MPKHAPWAYGAVRILSFTFPLGDLGSQAMYSCVPETGCGFFEGVCTFSNASADTHDPPPIDSRIDSPLPSVAARVNGADGMLPAPFTRSSI